MNAYFRIPDQQLTPPDYENWKAPKVFIELHNCMTCGELARSEFCNELCHEAYLT